ncbi:MAG: transposase ISC1332 [Metallosphaera javensis (ex Sakai et al. 2022)]|nr:MAG: transposase ISC1332 [Metallosphaera javensis (ex Sakai et al. 2022)]
MAKNKNIPGRGNTMSPEAERVKAKAKAVLEEAVKKGVSLTEIEELVLQAAMEAERDAYLEEHDDVKNGTYFRYLRTRDDELRRVPRTRRKGFRPRILPEKGERTSEDYEEFLEALVLEGLSPGQVKAVLRSRGIEYPEVMDRVVERIARRLMEFKSTPLPHDLFAVYADVKFIKVRENEVVKEKAVYVAIGVDLDGNKFVLDYEIRENEDIDGWRHFLNGLISRGVSRVDVIVTDDFPGLDRLISTLFPSSQHQLCLVHLARNLYRALPDGEKEKVSSHLPSSRPGTLRRERPSSSPSAR